MRKVQKGNVSIKIWDIGGQPRFRGMWERYCRGVNVIVYMVDAANRDNLDAAASELHQLMEKPQLQVSCMTFYLIYYKVKSFREFLFWFWEIKTIYQMHWIMMA